MPRLPANTHNGRDAALHEASVFLESGTASLANALLFGDDDELREASEHMIAMSARVARFIEIAQWAA